MKPSVTSVRPLGPNTAAHSLPARHSMAVHVPSHLPSCFSSRGNKPGPLTAGRSLRSRGMKARERCAHGTHGRRLTTAPRHPCNSSQMTVKAASEAAVKEENLPLEDQLTNEKLRRLEHGFREADEDGGGGLNMHQFRIAMRQAMGDHLTDQELDIIFMKVDTNCDGTVDWEEYLSFMLLQYLEKDYINQAMQEKPFPKLLRSVPNMNLYQRFNDYIVAIQKMPTLAKTTSKLYRAVTDTGGKYVSVTKDGVVSFWTMAMQHIKLYKLEAPARSSGVWVVDMAYMSNVNMVAISTTAANITFYDLTTKFEAIKVVTALEVAATCMAYWVDPRDHTHAILLWGDTRGSISALEFSDCSGICFLQPSLSHSIIRVPFHQIQKGNFCGVRAYKLPNVHDEFVMRVKYVAPLGCFLSCCQTRSRSMFVGDLQQKKSSYFRVRMGILDFDYSQVKNVIVTGGKDTLVRVWNPYIPTKPVMLFHGHKVAIVHVIFNDKREHIISVSRTKEIHVFDLTTQTCIQSIGRKWVPLGPRPISAVCFNVQRQGLIVATNQMAIFEHREKAVRKEHAMESIRVVLYNKLFRQVVSGGANSIVSVWELTSGEKIFQFIAHERKLETGESEPVEISAMKFDTTLRRLITAAQNGCVRIWNFNNGALLRQLPSTSNCEVTALLCSKGRILTADWTKSITVYVDSADDDTVWKWPARHHDDITAMVFLMPSLVASASYDGDIILTSLDTGHVVACLSTRKSTKPSLATPYEARRVRKRASSKLNHESSPDNISLPSLPNSVATLTTRRATSYKRFNAVRAATRLSVARHCQLKQPGALADVKPYVRSTSKNNPTGLEAIYGESLKQMTQSHAAIEALLFLTTRKPAPRVSSLVAAGANGWVHFWSVHLEGGLLGQFNAAHDVGESITSLATDDHNEYLVTGSANGYIKVWHIANYCSEEGRNLQEARHRKLLHFPYLKASPALRKRIGDQSKHEPPPACSQPSRTWRAPLLVNSFRGHLQSVTTLDYASHEECIISGSADNSVRLWTLYGDYVGIFGQGGPWSSDLSKLHALYRVRGAQADSPNDGPPFAEPHVIDGSEDLLFMAHLRRAYGEKLPADVRRVASAATQRVLYRGIRPHWKLAKNIALMWIHSMKTRKRKESKGKVPLTEVDGGQRATAFVPSRTSPVLGKSYQKQRRHRKLPRLAKPRHFQRQCDVYSCLPFQAMVPVDTNLETPSCVLEKPGYQEKALKLKSPVTRSNGRNAALTPWRNASQVFKRASGLIHS